MFGFLKKLGKRSEPAPVAVPAPARSAPVAPASSHFSSSPLHTARSAPSPSGVPANGRAPEAPVPRPAALNLPAAHEAHEALSLSFVVGAPAPAPVPVPPATPPPAVVVELSLRNLGTKMSPEVTGGAGGHPDSDVFLKLPLPLLQAQLAKGAVRMPLAQFRNYTSDKLFPPNPEKELLEVEIPIPEVIPLLKPEHFARRPNQRRIEVPDDIGPIFGPNGGPAYGLRIADQKPRGAAPTPPAGALKAIPPSTLPAATPADSISLNGAPKIPTPAPITMPTALATAPAPVPLAVPSPIPSANPVPPRRKQAAPPPISDDIPEMLITAAPKRKAAPAPEPVETAPVATPFSPFGDGFAPISPIAAAPIPPAPETAQAVQDAIPEAIPFPVPVPAPPLHDEPIRAPKLDPSLATLRPKAPVPTPLPAANPAPSPTPAPVPARNPAQAQALEGNFTLALMDVAAYWAETGKSELANLYRHSLEIPMSTLEKTMRSGKLQFQWRELRPWLRLAPGNTLPTIADDLVIELPLAVVAPRFMEQRGLGKAKVRADLTGDIPEVFEQKQSPPATNGNHVAPPLGATAVPLDMAAALGASSKSGDTAFLRRTGGKPLLEFGEIFGQPEKKSWTMAEVTQKVMTLRGVAGAIIATSDGLLVSGSWSTGVKSDAVAAFVPQMYSKIIQYGKELNLGEPGNFTLTIENVPLQIFKTGNSYFTVIGRAGENLPKAQLNAVAMRLATTNK